MDKKIFVIAKIFDQQGCIAYSCKTPNEARCLPGTLEVLRADGVQIVVLDSPEMYPEYSPYTYIEDMKEYIDKVAKLNLKEKNGDLRKKSIYTNGESRYTDLER